MGIIVIETEMFRSCFQSLTKMSQNIPKLLVDFRELAEDADED